MKKTSEKPKKRRSVARSSDLGERITAIENTASAQHAEIMRILSEINLTMKENFDILFQDVKEQSTKQACQDLKIDTINKEIDRVDGKLNKVMGGIGAAAIAVVGGFFTILSNYLTK